MEKERLWNIMVFDSEVHMEEKQSREKGSRRSQNEQDREEETVDRFEEGALCVDCLHTKSFNYCYPEGFNTH